MKNGAYYDLVAVKNGEKLSLCVAPFCSRLNEGDFVDIDGGCAEVVDSYPVMCGTNMWGFIKRIYGDAEPMRIIAVYRKSVVDWEDEDNE